MPHRVHSVPWKSRKPAACKTCYDCKTTIVMIVMCVPRPPLRGYLLDGTFFIGGVIAGTLTKVAVRYIEKVKEPRSQNVSECL